MYVLVKLWCSSPEDVTFMISVCQTVEVVQQPVDPEVSEIKREELEEQDPQSAASSNSKYKSFTAEMCWYVALQKGNNPLSIYPLLYIESY